MTDLILLEDEPILRQELGEFLEDCGYRTDKVASLAEFAHAFEPQRHCLAIIDLGLPDGDGLHLIRQLREGDHRLGIVVLTGRNTTLDKIAGLEGGADHYLDKGCDLDELAATLQSLKRRLELGEQPRQGGEWRLELGPRRLHVPGAPAVALSQQDLVVLESLMSNAGEGVSRQMIVSALDEDYLHYDQRRLDTQMRRLRRKIAEVTGQELPVKTLRNAGYCFYANARIQP